MCVLWSEEPVLAQEACLGGSYLGFSKQQHADHGEEAQVEGQKQNDAAEAETLLY